MTRTSRQECRARAHARPRQNSVYATTQHTSPSEPSAKFTPRTVSLLAQLQHPSVRLSHRLQAASLGEEGRTIEQPAGANWKAPRSSGFRSVQRHSNAPGRMTPVASVSRLGGCAVCPTRWRNRCAPSRRMSVSDIERCVHKRRDRHLDCQ